MQVLIETRMNSLKLNEDSCKAPKKGCLGRLEGICADFKNPTRNGRLYPLDLWKKVFDDPLFKEALKNKTLFGELDHPEDRFEPLVKHACIVMTDYEVDEDKGVIYGGFDILDTPDGRVLRNILDYGSVLGVSSRGQGDIIETVEGERVDEDSYDFACFDVVSTPAVEKARQKVVESLNTKKKESFKESIERQISEAETPADLNIIRSVVRTSSLNSSDMDTIIESIEDKCKSLQVGETISTKNESDTQTLTESTKSCVDSAKTIRDNKKLYKCISSLREQVSAYKHREKRYIESLQSKEQELENKDTQISKLKESLSVSKSSINELKRSNFSNRNTVTQKEKQIDSLKESLRQEQRQSTKTISQKNLELKSVTEKYDRRLDNANARLKESKETIVSLENDKNSLLEDLKNVTLNRDNIAKELNSQRSKISKLQEKIEDYENKISCLEKEMETSSKEHSSEISSIDKEVDEYSKLLSEAQQRLNSNTETITSLKESLKTAETTLAKEKDYRSKLNESLKKYQKSYTDKIANVSGIDPKSIYHQITTDTTPEQINKIVESYRRKLDRYNKLGISNDGIKGNNYVVESLNTSYDSYEAEEQSKLLSFLQAATKSI